MLTNPKQASQPELWWPIRVLGPFWAQQGPATSRPRRLHTHVGRGRGGPLWCHLRGKVLEARSWSQESPTSSRDVVCGPVGTGHPPSGTQSLGRGTGAGGGAELDGGGRWPHVTDNGVCGTAGPSQEAQLLPHHEDGAGSRPCSSPDAPTWVGLTAAEDAGVPFTEERKPWSSGPPAR